MRSRVFMTLLLCTSLLGCVQNVRPLSVEDSQLFSPRTVFFATNRNSTGKENLNKRFGSERAEISFGEFQLCQKTVPSTVRKRRSNHRFR